MPTLLTLANLSIVPGAVLFLPIAVTLWFRWVALRADEAKQKLVWAGYRSFGRFILAVTVAAWWGIWDFAGRSSFVSIVLRTWPRSLEISSAASWRFWLPPAASLGIFLILCYDGDKTVLRLKWTTTDTLRQAWWRLVSSDLAIRRRWRVARTLFLFGPGT